MDKKAARQETTPLRTLSLPLRYTQTEEARLTGKILLVLGGTLSALAAVLHIAVIVGGPAWYRFVGAGEPMAQAAESGSLGPALLTFAIAAVLLVWAIYAFSGAGLVRRLPFLRTALILISGVYLLRASALLPVAVLRPELVTTFDVVTSLLVLAYGLSYAIGTWARWPTLGSTRFDSQKPDLGSS